MSFYHALATSPLTKQAAPQRSYLQRNLLDPVWNAGKAGLGQMGGDAQRGVSSMADQAVDGSLDFVNRNISQPMQNAAQSAGSGFRNLRAGAANGIDGAIDSGLNFVNNNISQPMRQAGQAASNAYHSLSDPGQVADLPPMASAVNHAAYRSMTSPGGAPQPMGPPAPQPQAPQPPMGQPAPSAYQAVGQPQQPQGPDYGSLFRNTHGGAFDPNSRVDRQKMEQLRAFGQSNPQMATASPNTFSRGFYQKSAGALLKGLVTGAGGLATKARARLGQGVAAAKPYAAPALATASKAMDGASKGLKSPLAGKAAVVGGGATVGGVVGQAIGKRDGLEEGVGKGLDAGLQTSTPQPSIAPDLLARIKAVFTGAQAAPAPQTVTPDRRAAIIQQILAGKAA